MKRMLRIALAVLLMLALPVALLAYGASLPSLYSTSYYAELPEMVARLRDTEGRRVILLGGSNVAFGVDTELMEKLFVEALGRRFTVCSFGLYGAVGAETMLSLSAPYLRDGDLVVLCFEPAADSQSSYFGATALWKCAEDHPELLLDLTPAQKSAMAGNYLGYLQERAAYVRAGEAPDPQGVYTKASFNERCDLVYDRPGNIMPLGYDTAVSVNFASLSPEPEFAAAVRSYAQAAAGKGAKVVLSFSPVNSACVEDKDQVYGYFDRCRTLYDCPAISDPNRYILDSGWFYDSNFHLNSAGAVLRTVMLAEDILGYWNYYKRVDYPLPEMPASQAAVGAEEDPAWAADFSFRRVKNGENGAMGYVVQGLSEEGQSKTVLRMPSGYEGLPVVGFDPGVFRDNSVLEELTLPDTVDLIPDRAFAGSSKLVRLVLLHENRTPGLGADPFGGAPQLRVLVPRGAYQLYREGAGCAINPWEAHLDRVTAY